MPRQQTTWPGSCLHDQSGLIKVARFQNPQRLNHEMRGTAGVFLPSSAPLNPKPPSPSSPGQKGSFRGKGVEPYLFSGAPKHISCCNAPHDREEQLVRLREATSVHGGFAACSTVGAWAGRAGSDSWHWTTGLTGAWLIAASGGAHRSLFLCHAPTVSTGRCYITAAFPHVIPLPSPHRVVAQVLHQRRTEKIFPWLLHLNNLCIIDTLSDFPAQTTDPIQADRSTPPHSPPSKDASPSHTSNYSAPFRLASAVIIHIFRSDSSTFFATISQESIPKIQVGFWKERARRDYLFLLGPVLSQVQGEVGWRSGAEAAD
ncbi:hypothetical protein NA56DRAFT_708171 [Hyaloscypha hepaticicola]|uniref:Uncharacterized protein n=1 Tax=Hyaloscypha hepaticicola TaxID=2082293 RepID=A0A2J6PSD7_9HELO|nr:hypothetical protein NA56DRAFT_708171 [Hyaloscypha hepaticicola]